MPFRVGVGVTAFLFFVLCRFQEAGGAAVLCQVLTTIVHR